MSNPRDEIPELRGPLFGITVQTWGTNSKSSNGMVDFFDHNLFGGNYGHVSISMKLPVTSTTREWIEKYCYTQTYEQFKQINGKNKTFEEYLAKQSKQIIPVSLKKQVTRAARYNSLGEMAAQNDLAFEQTYFDIGWSWWPGRIQNTEEDMAFEREGKHIEYEERWKKYLKPEQRIHRGRIATRKMNYAPSMIMHQRDLPANELERISQPYKIQAIEEKINLVKLLADKINGLSSAKMSPSIELMFENLGMNIKQLLEKTKAYEVHPANPDKFKEYLLLRLKERESELHLAQKKMQEEENSKGINKKIEDKFYDLRYQLNQAQQKKQKIETTLEKMAEFLKHLEGNNSEDTPYTGEINELVKELPFLSEHLQLKNGTLSPKSIENLITHVDELKSELELKSAKRNGSYLNLIKKYELLCKQHNGDKKGLEDALWAEDIAVGDVNAAKEHISKPDPKIQKLTSIQENLRNHKETGLLVSTEIETALNQAVETWRSQLDSPGQFITGDSIEAIKSKISKTQDEMIKLKEPLENDEKRLTDEVNKIQEELRKIQEFSEFYTQNACDYMVVGVRPQHQEYLPFQMNGNRGLSPLAMLKKMQELASPEAEKFNLSTNNCSLTAMKILEAGTEHDPLLHSIMSTRALGFFGTPQQVLENTKASRNAIVRGQKSNFFTSLTTARPFDGVLGYAMSIFMDAKAYKLKQYAGLALGAVVGLAKTPVIIISSLLNPKEGFSDLLHILELVYNRNSTGLKVGLTILATPAIIILAPLAAIQKGLGVIGKALASSFNYLASLFKKTPEKSMDEITVPVSSHVNNGEPNPSRYNNTILAALVNNRIKTKLDKNTITIYPQKSNQKTIQEFELQLKQNPNKVVVLSQKANDSIIKFLSKKDNIEIKQIFYNSCNQSLARVQKHMPKNRDEIDHLVKEAIKAEKTDELTGTLPPVRTRTRCM